jgi:hypothetical protein
MLQVTDYHSKNASNPYHSSLLEVTYSTIAEFLCRAIAAAVAGSFEAALEASAWTLQVREVRGGERLKWREEGTC